jgi:uncharacterized protein
MLSKFCCILPGILVALTLLPTSHRARAAEPAACRDIGRSFDLIKPGMVSLQLNSALFSATDAGCVELAERLLSAGASLEAREGSGPCWNCSWRKVR